MPATSTSTSTHTSTYSKVVHVTRKVQTDLLQIVDTYGFSSQDYVHKVISDIRVFLDQEVVNKVEFLWLRPGTNYVLFGFEYTVIFASYGLVDEKAGDIRYRPDLANAAFRVHVYYKPRWQTMDEAEKIAITRQLSLSWGPGGQMDYSGGTWIADKTYSMDGFGLPRRRFDR